MNYLKKVSRGQRNSAGPAPIVQQVEHEQPKTKEKPSKETPNWDELLDDIEEDGGNDNGKA